MSRDLAEPDAELTLRADAADARVASAWLVEAGAERGVPADQVFRLDHCLDEALANVAAHGGATAAGAPVLLRLQVRRDAQGAEAEVTVSDAGRAFDPITAEVKPRPATLAEAEPGGLGLVLIRRFADRLSYSYRDGRNHFAFAVRWGSP